MRARIFQQPKTSMQSGTAYTEKWALEYAPTEQRQHDPLMGWWGSSDTQSQVHLNFDSRDDAIAYAEHHGLPYDVELPPIRVHTPKIYADNFKFNRLENWTH